MRLNFWAFAAVVFLGAAIVGVRKGAAKLDIALPFLNVSVSAGSQDIK